MPDLVELIGDLGEWVEKAKEKVHEALTESVKTQVEAVVETAKELCPVDTGNLRDSIEGSISAGGHYGIVKVPTKEAYYGFMVHFGTEKMAGRPFLYQASERHSSEFQENIKKNLKAKEE